jgi:hypothetical protein
MSRTGTNRGVRRGAAAAAIGAVLVLATGVPASQAAEGSPSTGDPAVPAVDTQSLPVVAQLRGNSEDAREDAPGQNRGKDANGKAPGGNGHGPGSKQHAGPSPAATPSGVPSALRPAVTATPKPDSTPAPTAPAAVSPAPTSSAAASGTPAASRPAAPTPAGSAPASSGKAPGVAPTVPAAAPELPAGSAPAPAAPAVPETPAAAGGTTPAKPASPGSDAAGHFPSAEKDGAVTGAAPDEAPAARAAEGDVSATSGQGAYVPVYSMPQALPAWTPYAAAVPGNSARTSASLSAQPEPKSALVWLGSGLVGVAGAAGLVFFRLRNP